ncbi:ubiquinone biosynthesis O-methyltransferase, mitochondrial isoform X5 [Phoenix dactylifera]|uniref:Ubiquinone biosynthesis O-methyltransferase, mitochondrial isoform X5 n=1 Tax=Phoenix dactylifera TaxID=42345 RepID=A0A8B9AP95_PHODC|nr:ubiquinone biosynthesis O-methyltransferase, mitochondrial isoform X5 [Phoenix dactylifera]
MAWRSLHLFRDLYRSRDAFPKPFLQSPIATLLHPALSSALLQRRSHADAAPPPSAVQNPKASNASGDENKSPPFRSSLNEAEVAKFAAIAETWWDFEGPFKPLHLMNPTRVSFIRSTLCRHFKKDPYCARPFQGLQIIDVGCGGGILSEPLARMGATVTGIDAVEKNIKIARIHAASDPVTSSIEYCCTTADPLEFCKSLAALTAPAGATVISTINRSVRSYATAIIAAEYLLNWLPKGTHQWSRFLTSEELVLILQRASISVQEMAGFVYNPLTGEWSLSDDTSVNFIAFGTKGSECDS